jgi:hypothetical protein
MRNTPLTHPSAAKTCHIEGASGDPGPAFQQGGSIHQWDTDVAGSTPHLSFALDMTACTTRGCEVSQAVAAGDLLMFSGRRFVKLDGTTRPVGVAMLAAANRAMVDVQARGSRSQNRAVVSNKSGSSIAANNLIYPDSVHPGGVTATQPSMGFTQAIGLTGRSTSRTGRLAQSTTSCSDLRWTRVSRGMS